METAKKIKAKCVRCGYEWEAKYDPRRRYYQCPLCRYYNKKEEAIQNR
ncbi:MAG: hypothetical protein ACP5MT_03300 [Candidatus Acidifodinimicrobium sp.]